MIKPSRTQERDDPGALERSAPPFDPPLLGRDLYHELLRAPSWLDLLGVSCVFLVINLLLALAYVAVGGSPARGLDPWRTTSSSACRPWGRSDMA
ncbi:MAG TPA: hypothetical protein DEP35_03475 [Deltaproteobacteria bacterium]|nr:hypothetical protein [Deltaproteobacteria bacterium]